MVEWQGRRVYAVKKFISEKRFLPHVFGLSALLLTLCLVKWTQISRLALLLRVLLVVFGYLAALCDAREKRVPNKLIIAMMGGWVLIMVPQMFFVTEEALGTMADGLAGFLTGGLIFWLVYAISRGGLGGGDVKLAATSGLYLGLDGVLSMMLYGSVLAASTGVVLILLKKIKPKDQIPLVPFLYVGILLTVFVR